MKALSKATIYQVAQRAGVSIATVSRALRDSDLVTPDTRARVRAAAAELRFTPNRSGRSLAEGRHAANGIVFPDLVGPYYAELVLGYEAAAAAFGSSVLILATHGRPDAAAAVRELAGRVDGLAIITRTVGDDVVGQLAATGLPLVLLAREPVARVDTIRTRNEPTAVRLTEHLLAHGHRSFVFLGDPEASPDVAGRYAGFSKAVTKAGESRKAVTKAGESRKAVTKAGESRNVPCRLDIDGGRAAAAKILRDPPDAIVCANDEVALGVHLAAEDRSISIPGDVAVTGWDDLMAARFAGLTTVAQPMRELGATAARWLHDRITGEQGRARRRVLPTHLVVRRSCGPHPLEDQR